MCANQMATQKANLTSIQISIQRATREASLRVSLKSRQEPEVTYSPGIPDLAGSTAARPIVVPSFTALVAIGPVGATLGCG